MRKFIVIAGNNQSLVKKALAKRGNWEDVTEEKSDCGDLNNVHFIWKPTNLPIRTYAKMDSNPYPLEFLQIINHFENNNGICTKTGLIRSLRAYYLSTEDAILHRYTLFETTPTTFLITAGDENQEFSNLATRFKDISKKNFNREHIPEKHCQENLWLIKPANLNQGRGIEIFKDFKDIQSFLAAQPPNTYWVAQKYIEKPLLFYGRKFDIRVWVLVTAKMEIFFYKTAYMRTSSDAYVTNVFNNYIHLTNNCLQKHGDNFGKFEPGNTLPLSALQDYLDECFSQYNVSVEKHIIPRMKDLIIDTILSVKKVLNPRRRRNCFELFGYDFLIDEDFRTWLLEVNTNPYLGVPNEFIRNLLPKMMDDLLGIVVDPYYPPTNTEFQNSDNSFEIIYCEHHSAYHEGPLNVRSPYHENIYPNPSIAPPLRHVKNGHNEKENRMRDLSETKSLIASNIFTKSYTEKETLDKPKEKQDAVIGVKRNTSVKPATVTSAENYETQALTSSTIASGRENRFSVGQQNFQERPERVFNHNGIAETARKIEMLLETYTFLDYDSFLPLISRLLSSLTNWELQSDKEIATACKAILTLSESRICGALTEPNLLNQMIKLLDSQNVPLKIQITVIKGFLNTCKKISEKKKIICDKMIHALIKIIIASCDAAQVQNYDSQIFQLAVKCLGALSGKYNRKMYIPGETRDHDKVRDFLIHQGGIVALMIISKLSLDEEVRQMPKVDCFCYLEISDWELQKNILEKLKEGKIPLMIKDPSEEYEMPTGATTNNTSIRNKINVNGSSSISTNKFEKKAIDPPANQLFQGMTPNVPRYLLERPDYTIDALIQDVEDRISILKEEKRKQEQEEVEKKEQMIQEQMKEQQERELIQIERRKRAEEIFLKRLEEKKKQQDENYKKMEEETKARRQMEEEQRKLKMQELVKKKEEYERKAKKIEMKKKKLEEEMKKIVEGEIEKKKAQRKALEESFWSRVRAKQKDRTQERNQNQMDPFRNKEDPMQTSMERTSNADTNLSQEDLSQKSNFLRTQTLGSPYHLGTGARSNTFSNFFKDDSNQTASSPINSSNTFDGNKAARQKSVDEVRNKKKGKEDMVLPYIDINNNKANTKNPFEKSSKLLKQSGLFILNEAIAEEDTNTFADDNNINNHSPNILIKQQIYKQPSSVRNEDAEKLKKVINSTESIRPKHLIHLKEIADPLKEKEKEKYKESVLKSKEIVLGGQRQTSPQHLHDLANTNVYRAYAGVRRKVKIQALVKH